MLCIGDPHTTKGAATSDPISPCHKHASSSIKWSYPYERACMRRARVILYKCCGANESEWMSESEWVLLVQLLCALPLQLLPCWRVVRLEKTLTLSLAHRFVNATHTGVTISLWFHSRALKTAFLNFLDRWAFLYRLVTELTKMINCIMTVYIILFNSYFSCNI